MPPQFKLEHGETLEIRVDADGCLRTRASRNVAWWKFWDWPAAASLRRRAKRFEDDLNRTSPRLRGGVR